ncbi:DUF3983 domain-containing protein [Bacillus manliponensis]|nr:DUF3983 domain-containing protein [Bacillus manliponensis]
MPKLKKKKMRKALKRRAKAVDNYQFAKAFRNIFVRSGIVEGEK